MPIIDLRDKTKVLKNGSSCIDLGMTGAQLDEALGTDDAVAGWVRFSYQQGGDIGADTDAQRIREEGGAVITSVGVVDDFTIQNTAQQTDARSLKILKWMEANEVPVRYFLPTNDPTVAQVHFHPAMSKDEGGRITTSQGVRTTGFTLRGDEARHVYDDLPVVQTSWPDAFAGAKDAAIVDPEP